MIFLNFNFLYNGQKPWQHGSDIQGLGVIDSECMIFVGFWCLINNTEVNGLLYFSECQMREYMQMCIKIIAALYTCGVLCLDGMFILYIFKETSIKGIYKNGKKKRENRLDM